MHDRVLLFQIKVLTRPTYHLGKKDFLLLPVPLSLPVFIMNREAVFLEKHFVKSQPRDRDSLKKPRFNHKIIESFLWPILFHYTSKDLI